jgi:lipoprotein-releasing system permease protein
MRLAFHFAVRYLFAKKSVNVINIISAISVLGLALGTAALVLVLAVFNGFEKLLGEMVSNFNPEIKITATKGKMFHADTLLLSKLQSNNGIAYLTQTLEEVAFFEYAKTQDFGVLKGVDTAFRHVNRLDLALREGKYALEDADGRAFAILGGGIRNKLGVNVDNFTESLRVFMPKRGEVSALEMPFKTRLAYPAATFSIQQEFDEKYVFTNLDFVRELLGSDDDEVSALEIRVAPNTNPTFFAQQLQRQLGSDYQVRDRFQQNAAFLKLMNLEKWLGYAIVTLMLLLIAFNMVGTLWMMVLEKKRNIAVLRAMGAGDQLIRWTVLAQGLLLSGIGIGLGLVVAYGLYAVHIYSPHGILQLPVGSVIDRYPVELRGLDMCFVSLTVLLIGFWASFPAARRAQREVAVFS